MKEIMVDLDNTLVDFTKMLFNNIERNFGYKFDTNDVQIYDFSDLFYRNGCSKEEIYSFFKKAYSDNTLYTEQLIKSEYFDDILSKIRNWKKNGYKIICHTKVSSAEMKQSKEKMFNTLLKDIFDDVILEFIDGKSAIKSVKDCHYDIIVDDSPYIIENYLNKNDKGIVYLPKMTYNDYMLHEEKYKDRIIPLDGEK